MTRARDVADTQDNLGGAVPPITAGKNRVINGAMDFWQRGTTFGPTSSTGYFTADRWFTTPTLSTYTLSQETSIVPTGFQYALKATANGTTGIWFIQFIESQNCQDLAGKTVTLSAYCATSDSSTVDFIVYYNTTFGAVSATGGWTAVTSAVVATTATMPATPQSRQFAIPSTAKTLAVYIRNTGSIASGATLTVTGVQLEQGSVATPFSRHAGTVQGELAACQRYYWRVTETDASAAGIVGHMFKYLTGDGMGFIQLPVTMRTTPTSLDTSNIQFMQTNLTNNAIVGPALNAQYSTNQVGAFTFGQTGLANGTQGYASITANNGYIGFSAEL